MTSKFLVQTNQKVISRSIECEPTITLFQTYFPKYGKQQIGRYQESQIDGLYIEHTLDAYRLLIIIIITSVFIVGALGVSAY